MNRTVKEGHTLGPWVLREEGAGWLLFSGGLRLARVYGRRQTTNNLYPRARWNAVLMCLAPDLLSVAEEVLILAAEQLSEEQYGRMKSGLDRLDVAIRKARGE